MTTILSVLGVVILLFVALELFLAHFMATLILEPAKNTCPTYQDVRERKNSKIASEREAFANTDWDEYDAWESEEMELMNGDTQITGVYHPVESARGCAILAHGFGQNRLAMVPQAVLFRKLGFDVVLFDQRRFGRSTAKYGSFGYLEGKDVACIVEWVKNRCGEDAKVVVCGVSMGAVSVMNALRYTDKIDYCVSDCGFARFRQGYFFVYNRLIHIPNPFLIPIALKKAQKLGIPLDQDNPVEAVTASDVPICVVHGDQDTAVSVECAYELKAVLRNPKSRVEIFPGREHGYAICDHEKYYEMLRDFLKDVV